MTKPFLVLFTINLFIEKIKRENSCQLSKSIKIEQKTALKLCQCFTAESVLTLAQHHCCQHLLTLSVQKTGIEKKQTFDHSPIHVKLGVDAISNTNKYMYLTKTLSVTTTKYKNNLIQWSLFNRALVYRETRFLEQFQMTRNGSYLFLL